MGLRRRKGERVLKLLRNDEGGRDNDTNVSAMRECDVEGAMNGKCDET
jgi:hypothetical protein